MGEIRGHRAAFVVAVVAAVLVGVVGLGPASPGPSTSAAVAAAPTLRDLGAARGVLMGTAVGSPALLADPDYSATLAHEYGGGVSENDMKWGPIHPAPGTYAFAPADGQVAFLEANAMAVRGHNLAWWNQNPAWLLNGPWTRDQLIAVLRDHIHTVVGHYAGRIREWDVVNEAIGLDGQPWANVWAQKIGFPDYLDLAFTFAHEADPSAKLFYNDFLLEAPGPRFDAVLAMVTGMKARGVPIDGIGFQAHLGTEACGDACVNRTLANMVRAAAAGLSVSITELDVAVPLPATPEKLADQATVYRSVLQACLLAPSCHTFFTWGFTDAHSWIPSQRPGFGAALPFDEQYRPKPAYDAMVATLQSPPVAPTCASYADQVAAQAAFDAGILGAPLLDPDGDGVACASLPAPSTTTTTAASALPVSTSTGAVTPTFTG
ncbi:MAG: endo-1,4-beta-xylanase [Acidimicrobiales bacterium]